MVAPVPAHISTSCPRLRTPPAASPQLTTPTHCPSLFPSSSPQLLCFLSHPCNPSSFMRLRTLLRNGAPLSLLFSMASALFLSPRGCTPPSFPTTDFQASNTSTLLFAKGWSLFVVSLHAFLHSFPLFSMACGLFSENTRVGVSRMQLSRLRTRRRR